MVRHTLGQVLTVQLVEPEDVARSTLLDLQDSPESRLPYRKRGPQILGMYVHRWVDASVGAWHYCCVKVGLSVLHLSELKPHVHRLAKIVFARVGRWCITSTTLSGSARQRQIVV